MDVSKLADMNPKVGQQHACPFDHLPRRYPMQILDKNGRPTGQTAYIPEATYLKLRQLANETEVKISL